MAASSFACPLRAHSQRRGSRQGSKEAGAAGINARAQAGTQPLPRLAGVLEVLDELAARRDAELAIDLRDVPLHRLRAHEEPVRGLLVGEAGGEQLGDAVLGRRQLGHRGAPSDAGQLAARPLAPEPGPERVEDRERGLERFARRALLAIPAPSAPQHEQRARALERLAQPVAECERPLQLGGGRFCVAWAAASSPRLRAAITCGHGRSSLAASSSSSETSRPASSRLPRAILASIASAWKRKSAGSWKPNERVSSATRSNACSAAAAFPSESSRKPWAASSSKPAGSTPIR